MYRLVKNIILYKRIASMSSIFLRFDAYITQKQGVLV